MDTRDRPDIQITEEMIERGAQALFDTLGPTDSPYTHDQLAKAVLKACLSQA